MPWTVQLTDGTTTVNLNDQTNTFLNLSGFHAPPPAERASYAGMNLFRHGGDLIERRYDNRTVDVRFDLKGSNADNLASRIQDVNDLLRKAEEWASHGLGTQVQLQYQWSGATDTVYFNIIKGDLDLGRDLHTEWLRRYSRIKDVHLQIECEPFAVGAAETLENLVKDPSFEIAGSPLADWTTGTVAAGDTVARSTLQAKYGTTSVQLVRGASSGTVRIYQDLKPQVTGTTDYVARVYVYRTGSGTAQIRVRQFNSLGTGVGDDRELLSTATGTWVALDITSATATADATTGTIEMEFRIVGGTGTATAYFDGAYFATGTSALPRAWVSGRDVYNHFDDNGQAHINYLDVYGMPGDVLSPIQVKAREAEDHAEFWIGARHAGRATDTGIWHEAEDFGTWHTEPSDADRSGSAYGQWTIATRASHVTTGTAAANTGTLTITNATSTGANRLGLVSCHVNVGNDETIPAFYAATATWGGTGMTLIGTDSSASGGVKVWYLLNPPTGASEVLITPLNGAGAGSPGILGVALSFHGIKQTTALIATGSGNANVGGTATGSLTGLATGDIILAWMSEIGTSANIIVGAGAIEEYDRGSGSTRFAAQSRPVTTATGSVYWENLSAGPHRSLMAAFRSDQGNVGTPAVFTKAIATPPDGLYRAIAQVRNPDAKNWNVGLGYLYGSVTTDPSQIDHYTTLGTGTAWRMLDIGALTIPPVKTPQGGTKGTMTLRLAVYHTGTLNATDIDFECDSLMLLPVDQGMGYVSKTSTRDVVWSDSRSTPAALYLMTTADGLVSAPANQLGRPPYVHPKGSRYYMVAGSIPPTTAAIITHTWKVSVTYVPRFIHVD